MLIQRGKQRVFSHNLKLAVLLTTAAGSVNAASWFAFNVLTTNVTGHAALLATEVVAERTREIEFQLLWLFLFFFGAFCSAIMIQVIGKWKPRFSHTLPLIIEIIILIFVAYEGERLLYEEYSDTTVKVLAGSLLFAMGLQNAMVTMVSGAVVRTTHLTGLFTDFGITVANLVMHIKNPTVRRQFSPKFLLQVSIIVSFLTGGIVGGLLYAEYLFYSFVFPLSILFTALLFDAANIYSIINKNKNHD
ncbi:MAG: DUF1275 domain-containing protein [Bernardetiaceae bacterium]|nr:DUF1275 domain-containing protein [Bernardetiaceae bacterium]